MALTGINPEQNSQKGPSPLENAAKVIGILGTVAQLGNSAFGGQNDLVKAQTDYYNKLNPGVAANSSSLIKPQLNYLQNPNNTSFPNGGIK